MAKRYPIGKYVGFCKYLVWGEKKHGQDKPTQVACARTRKEAGNKWRDMDLPYKYVLKIERVWGE